MLASVVPVDCDKPATSISRPSRTRRATEKISLPDVLILQLTASSKSHPKEICENRACHGGQVYMDGANLNAQVGLADPLTWARTSASQSPQNFLLPHGGADPAWTNRRREHLVEFLPGHSVVNLGGENSNRYSARAASSGAVSAAPWGSASILTSPGLHRCDGRRGLTEATKYAILNATTSPNGSRIIFPCFTAATPVSLLTNAF